MQTEDSAKEQLAGRIGESPAHVLALFLFFHRKYIFPAFYKTNEKHREAETWKKRNSNLTAPFPSFWQ